MDAFDSFDWSTGTPQEHLEMVCRGSSRQWCKLARNYDWGMHPEAVLSWVMAQRGVDLGTAVIVFLNGDPGRFNYLSKRDVPEAFRGTCRLLDNICLRVNSGFYLNETEIDRSARVNLKKWLAYQRADGSEGRAGRWVLDSTIVEPLVDARPGKTLFSNLRRQPPAPRGRGVFPKVGN